MLTLPGYRVVEPLYRGSRTAVSRAVREEDGARVVLKAPAEAYPSPEARRALERELDLGRSLHATGVIRYLGLARHGGDLALIVEDIGGVALDRCVPEQGLPLDQALQVAERIADALAALHAADIVHKDLTPANVVWNQRTGAVRIIDLSLATRMSRQQQAAVRLDHLEGTLAYIAPEQTGRTNRPVDYRADLYALGGTLAFLLTGRPPFAEITDPLELVYAHLASPPPAPSRMRPELPVMLDKVVQRCMAKSPESRYRSAVGVRYDLRECARRLAEGQALDGMPLGKGDVSGRFHVPERLVGREGERQALLDAFQRAADGPAELVLVSGWSGIGKTALVDEVQRPIAQARGHFVSGKFDQFGRERPYSAVGQAFADLVDQLLTLPEDRVDRWRALLTEALGGNGRVVTELVPELELLLGQQDPVADLAGRAADNRFRMVIRRFVDALASADHPLVLFLDDLQWADSATLHLLQLLLQDDDARHLLLIGGYRDNEVDAAHPLRVTLDALTQAGARVTELALGPLGLDQVTTLVSDTLDWSRQDAAELSTLCATKTGGNPFFLHQFLARLYHDGHIHLDATRGRWRADLERIRAADLTDNVVELMAASILELEDRARAALVTASIVGNRFTAATLAMVSSAEADAEAVQADLQPAAAAGLVIPDGQGSYRFLHDRVQQAAASLLDEDARTRLRLRIGQHLLPQLDKDEDRLFEIADHLDAAQALVQDPSQRQQLLRLNLRAAAKARGAMAYASALRYVDLALEMLGDDPWATDHDLALALHIEALEAAYSGGDFARMQAAGAQVRAHARDMVEKVRVAEIEIQHLNSQQQPGQAVEVALKTLAELGEPLKPSHSKVPRIVGLLKIKLAMRGRSPSELVDLPPMTDLDKLACMRVLSFATTSAYYSRPDVLPYIIYKMVELSLSHGNSPYSPNGWIGLALVLCGPANDIDSGYEIGQAAVEMQERFGSRDVRARVYFPISIFVRHWKEHLRVTLPTLLNVYQMGMDVGDVEYACLGPQLYLLHLLVLGTPLPRVLAETRRYQATFRALKQTKPLVMTGIYAELAAQLSRREDPDQVALSGDYFDEEQDVPELIRAEDGTSLSALYISKLQLAVSLHRLDAAEEALEHADRWFERSMGTVWPVLYHHYRGLLAWRKVARGETRWARLGRASEKKLAGWTQHSPMNVGHRYHLVAGTGAWARGRHGLALEHLDQAIDLAREHGYTQVEGEACEQAATVLIDQGKARFARTYLVEARDAFERWGAIARLRVLEQRFGEHLPRRAASTGSLSTTTTSPRSADGSTKVSDVLDLSTVLRASQVISVELQLPQLLRRLLDILMQSAGAQSAALVLPERGRLLVQAQGRKGDSASFEVLQRTPPEASSLVSAGIVRYAQRTRKPLLLADARDDENFARDPHVQSQGTRSVLCLPLLSKGELAAVLYLENNLAAGAFTDERQRLLELLSAQIVTSLENARLYDDLTELNRAYGRFVPHELLHLLGQDSIVDVRAGDSLAGDMAVFFSDIRGFTSLSEKMSAAQTFRFINAYLQRLAPAVLHNGGIIDKYIGDAIMAFFPKGAEGGIRAAVALQDRLRAYNVERVADGKQDLAMGVGLHIGPLMLGTVGHENRLNTTVIGDTVNVASRLEGLTKVYGTPVLVSERVVERLVDPGAWRLREIDQVQVKGKQEPLVLFELLDALGDDAAAATRATGDAFTAGLSAYRQQRFTQALAAFQGCVAAVPSDRVATLYVQRCLDLVAAPPGPDWTPVTVHT